jgi:hypothetical protein
MIAHAAGIPVEETLLPLLSGVSAGLLLARAWVVCASDTHGARDMPDYRTLTVRRSDGRRGGRGAG